MEIKFNECNETSIVSDRNSGYILGNLSYVDGSKYSSYTFVACHIDFGEEITKLIIEFESRDFPNPESAKKALVSAFKGVTPMIPRVLVSPYVFYKNNLIRETDNTIIGSIMDNRSIDRGWLFLTSSELIKNNKNAEEFMKFEGVCYPSITKLRRTIIEGAK